MKNTLSDKIEAKKAVVGIIGMGYIGLSLLDAFGKAGYSIIGYDNNEKKIQTLKNGKTYLNFLDHKDLFSLMKKKRFVPSNDPKALKKADIILISVPTSLDRYRIPDLTNLRDAFKTVSSNLKKDQLIILQSSTYPGTTEEELLPLLEKTGLKVGKDFYLAHVPEIADIGNPDFTFSNVPRIVSGITPESRKLAERLYESLGCSVYSCDSTTVAEAAKLLQNAYRLVNISFINEMKMMFDRMGLDVWQVIEAAASKPFGFTPFQPGPGIGGDCIPIAPFYLAWKAKVSEGPTTLLEQSGHINEMMPIYVLNKIIQGLNRKKTPIRDAKILVLGVGYKKDVNDIRESPGLKILSLLKKMQADIHYHDPYVLELSNLPDYPHVHLKSVHFDYKTLKNYDAVVIVTDHSFYDWNKVVASSNLVIDTRNATDKIKGSKQKIIKA